MNVTDVLRQEHRVIEQVLDCLQEMADRARASGDLDRESAAEALEFFRTFADTCHHGKEEDSLFAAMVRKGVPRHVGPLAVMFTEHDIGRRAVHGMGAALERGEVVGFADHASAYVDLLRDHIAKEDNILFPLADSVLDGAVQEELWSEFERVENEDLGAGLHESMIAIADRLAERFDVKPARERSVRPFGGCCHSSASSPGPAAPRPGSHTESSP